MADLTGSIAIGYVNRASGKVITATTAATGYPASNLSTSLLSQAWRSTAGSLTSQSLIADLTSAQDIDVIALVGFNGEDDATAQFRTSENSNLSSPEYDSGTITAWDVTTYPALVSDASRYGRNTINFPGATKNSRYVGITLSDSGNPDNQLKGRVFWAGPIWQPTYSFEGKPDTFRKRREIVGSPGQERYVTTLEVGLHCLSEIEGRKLESLCSARLRTGRLLVAIRPTQTATFQSEAVYCILEGLPVLSAWPQGGGLIYWKVTLTFREVED